MLPRLDPDVMMGFYFSPRGGSAQVARYLCLALGDGRWAPRLFTGSVGAPNETGHAGSFFQGIDCDWIDYSAAQAAWSRGKDPMELPVPMHASFEAKPNVPDRSFLDLDDHAYARQVASWTSLFRGHAAHAPRVVHLHHLTPMHQAVRNVWPKAPVITHLHGTELKMLASVQGSASGSSVASDRGARQARDDRHRWSTQWTRRMRRWAADSHRLITVSAQDRELASALLDVDGERITTIANGVDTDVFCVEASPAPADRMASWRSWLVDEPKGWLPGGEVGSIRYQLSDLDAFLGDDSDRARIVLFVGRFMAFKRLQLLVEAHHAMRVAGHRRSVLVIAGGYPGEWEGEHPYDTVRRLGAEDVFFVGWRDHHELAKILGCVDVFAAPSVDEPFGLVYLEAMAAGVAPIATATGGPLQFINVDPTQPTGWLVEPDSREDLVTALVEAVSDEQRSSRGKLAAHFVREHYSWARTADAFADVYEEVSVPRAR